jgi:hypothetical protein
MAVNVNSVYQKVLALANKEQRGYITPQEFNYFADQAQLDIFEGYFNDLARFLRMQSNDTVYADKVDAIQERIDFHEKFRQDVTMGGGGVGTLPTHYKIGKLSYNDSGTYREIQLIPQNELNHYINSSYLNPTTKTPIYIKTSATAIQVYPTSITSGVTCNLIEKPATPDWGYVVINGKALYNSSASTNFDLHEAEENNLVMRILELSGITLKDQVLSGIALRDQSTDKAEKNS